MTEQSLTDPDAIQQRKLTLCEERLGYQFRDRGLLRAALTHASGAEHRLASNERLEFLGDAILGQIICERLFHDYPDYLEGDLTRVKSVVVSRHTCAKASARLALDDCLILGKGMTQAPVPMSVLADVFESLVAAVHLDGGVERIRDFVLEQLGPEIAKAASGDTGANYKSQLQQLVQKEFGVTPYYNLVDEKGPDHQKAFQVAVSVGQDQYAPAWGRNKKEAEQKAALNALEEIDDQSPADAAEEKSTETED